MKTIARLLLPCLLAAGFAAQDDPSPAPTDGDPAESPQPAPGNPPPAVTNAPLPAVVNPALPPANPAPARDEILRQALERAVTNRLPQSLTNRMAFPAPPTFPSPGPRGTNQPVRPTTPPGVTFPTPGATQPPSLAAPPTPGVPAPGPAPATAQAGAPPAAADGNLLTFNNAPLDVIFDRYQELAQRTVLRPANLAGQITIKTHAELSREEAIQALEGALSLNNITLIPQGEKFVKAVPVTEANLHGAAVNTNEASSLPESERFVTHVAQLKIAKPSEVASLFAQSFTKNAGGLVPIDSSQILVIRDYSSNVKRMLEMLEKIDVVPETDFKLEVIPIRYGKVGEIYDTMSSIISGGGGGGYVSSRARTTGTGSRFGTTTRGRPGTLGQYGQPGQYQPGVTQPGMTPLQSTLQQRTTTPGASTFQQRLNQIVSRAAGESDIQILQDARIVPDERANSLIVFANKTDMAMITNIVAKVDQLLAQVLIEAVILEVSFNDSLNFGVSAVQSPHQWGDFTGAGGYNNGPSFLSGITNFPSGLPDGFSYWGKLNPDLNVAVTAIAKKGNAKVLSRPRVQTSHANPGYFFIGESVPYITGTYDYGGYYGSGVGARSQYTEKQIGIQLDVTPFITPEGFVVMDISQSYDSRGADVTIDGNPVPIINNRQASAMLTVRDGEAVMLGGFITENRNKSNSGVPVLKDIPLLGALFRSTSRDSKRVELLVFMRATVLKTPEAASALVEKERSQLPGLMEAEAEFLRSHADRLRQAQDHMSKTTNALPADLRLRP